MAKERLVIRRAAMEYLARREHSKVELEKKLCTRFEQNDCIASVIDELQVQGLQSDQRFAENFIRWRANKGFGPLHIEQDLKRKGVDDIDIQQAFKENNINWQVLIEQQYIKKYGLTMPQDMNSKARCQRFLLSRGFSFSQIKALWQQIAAQAVDVISTRYE